MSSVFMLLRLSELKSKLSWDSGLFNTRCLYKAGDRSYAEHLESFQSHSFTG